MLHKIQKKFISRIVLLSYMLTFVGYMTLTLSMSTLSDVANGIGLSLNSVQMAMSLSFLMFSFSAIFLSTLSDVLTARKILVFAQSISICGLLLLSVSLSEMFMYISFIMIGLGTGCYSSISRSMISRNTTSNTQMKKSFAVLSISIIIAPLASTYLFLIVNKISWRLVYVAMALIEIILFVYSRPILKSDQKRHHTIKIYQILSNFKGSLSQPMYVLNVVVVAVLFSLYLGVLVASLKNILTMQPNVVNGFEYSIIILGLSLLYILGVFTYRYNAAISHTLKFQIPFIILLFIAALAYSVFKVDTISTVICMYVICYCIGLITPLSTGMAMSVIKHGHGVAAAMLTFSVTFMMSIWWLIKANSTLSEYGFVVVAIWATFVVLILARVMLFFYTHKSTQTR